MSTNLPDSTWNRSTAGGIPYKLVKSSGGISEYQVTATEEIIIQTDKLAALGLECFPAPIVLLGKVFYPTRRRYPGLPHLHVSSLTWDAMDDGKPVAPFIGGGAPTYYEHVKVVLNYVVAPHGSDQQPDPNDPLSFLDISVNVAGSFIHGELRLATDEADEEIKDPNVPHMIPEVLTEWTLRWKMIPVDFFDNVLVPRMRERLGKVNETASRIWKNAPAETILFLGYDFSTEKSWIPDEGITTAPIQCTMKFLEKNFKSNGKQITHNHFWVPGGKKDEDPKGWQKIKFENGSHSFETTNMDAIFTG